MNDNTLKQEILSIADYLGCNGAELWNEVKPILTKAEARAREEERSIALQYMRGWKYKEDYKRKIASLTNTEIEV